MFFKHLIRVSLMFSITTYAQQSPTIEVVNIGWGQLLVGIFALVVTAGVSVFMMQSSISKTIKEHIDGLKTEINEQLNKLENRINKRIDDMENRIEKRFENTERQVDKVENRVNPHPYFFYSPEESERIAQAFKRMWEERKREDSD